MTRSRSDIIVAYGDSQTAGFSWGNKLVELSGGKIKRAINRGASGQSSGTVGIRQGGVELSLLTEDVTISGVAPVDVQFQASIAPCNNRTPSIPGEFGGVRGVFTIVTPNAPEGRPSGTFTANVAPATPVNVAPGDKFMPEDVLDHPEYGEYLHIIWAGGNDRAYNGSNAAPGTVLAAKAQVDRLRTFVDEPLFLVAGPTVYSSEVEGTTGHTRAIQARDQLAQEFPDNFVNIWEHVRDNGLDILGISPTAEDETALAGKSMPPSLTADNIHFSTAVREGVIAPFILDAMLSRGWLDSNPGGGSGMAEYDPTVWKNKPSTETPINAANLNKIESGIVSAVTAANEASEAANGLVSELESKANVDAVTTGLDSKVDKVSTSTVVYGTNSGGNPNTISYATAATASTIPYRGSGGVLQVGAPTAANHAVTKQYVDSAVDGKVSAADFNALVARVAALETPAE